MTRKGFYRKGPFPSCLVVDCSKVSQSFSGSYCSTHAARSRRGSDPHIKSQYEKTERQRFWEKVKKSDGCWEWTGAVYHKSLGYGAFRSPEAEPSGRTIAAHRVSFFYHYGYLPRGQENHIDHLCRNSMCVNPAHLEHVSNTENVLRGVGPTAVNARKTHCIYGHEFTEENTSREGRGRHCKLCHRRVNREWARKNRQKKGGS